MDPCYKLAEVEGLQQVVHIAAGTKHHQKKAGVQECYEMYENTMRRKVFGVVRFLQWSQKPVTSRKSASQSN